MDLRAEKTKIDLLYKSRKLVHEQQQFITTLLLMLHGIFVIHFSWLAYKNFCAGQTLLCSICIVVAITDVIFGILRIKDSLINRKMWESEQEHFAEIFVMIRLAEQSEDGEEDEEKKS